MVTEIERKWNVNYPQPIHRNPEFVEFNLQQAAEEIRVRLCTILNRLNQEERELHHQQISRLMKQYEALAQHKELAAQEITIALVGCAFGILSAGFDDKGSAGRALSAISTICLKVESLVQGLNDATTTKINADIKRLEIVMRDLDAVLADTRNCRREVDNTLKEIEDSVARILQKCF